MLWRICCKTDTLFIILINPCCCEYSFSFFILKKLELSFPYHYYFFRLEMPSGVKILLAVLKI